MSYNYEIIGPVKISLDVFKKIKKEVAERNLDIDTMSCFSLIKLALGKFIFKIQDSEKLLLHEIDNIEDLEKAKPLMDNK